MRFCAKISLGWSTLYVATSMLEASVVGEGFRTTFLGAAVSFLFFVSATFEPTFLPSSVPVG